MAAMSAGAALSVPEYLVHVKCWKKARGYFARHRWAERLVVLHSPAGQPYMLIFKDGAAERFDHRIMLGPEVRVHQCEASELRHGVAAGVSIELPEPSPPFTLAFEGQEQAVLFMDAILQLCEPRARTGGPAPPLWALARAARSRPSNRAPPEPPSAPPSQPARPRRPPERGGPQRRRPRRSRGSRCTGSCSCVVFVCLVLFWALRSWLAWQVWIIFGGIPSFLVGAALFFVSVPLGTWFFGTSHTLYRSLLPVSF